MRKKFVKCKDRKTAWDLCPWAKVVEKVDGGFMVFESHTDFTSWCYTNWLNSLVDKVDKED